MNNLAKQYINLIQDTLDYGINQKYNNENALSIFNKQIRLDMNQGFPITTINQPNLDSLINDLLSPLKNEINPPENDLYQSEKQKSGGNINNQLTSLINTLKNNPDKLDQIINQNINPFQIYIKELTLEERYEIKSKKYGIRNTSSQEIYTFGPKEVKKWLDEQNIPSRKISLITNKHSIDIINELQYHIAIHALTLEILTLASNMIPDELILNLGNTYIKEINTQQAKELINNLNQNPLHLPKLRIKTNNLHNILTEDINITLEYEK
jgi:thymidylate synthase